MLIQIQKVILRKARLTLPRLIEVWRKSLKSSAKEAISVNQLHIAHQKSLVSEYVTISLRVHSLILTREFSPELLIALADKTLYEAKEQGSNQACLYVAD